MTTKPESSSPKANVPKIRKVQKGARETARLFINVEEISRRPSTVPLSRYVE